MKTLEWKIKKWLGREDSNLRMPVPKTGALPLGYAPLHANVCVGFNLRRLHFNSFAVLVDDRLLNIRAHLGIEGMDDISERTILAPP